MKTLDKNKTKQQTNRLKSVPQRPKSPATGPSRPQAPSFRSRQLGNPRTQIISGYFVEDKSYKEMVISRINTSLCLILAFLVSVCVVSYYFVTLGEIQLNKIQKETLALNYDNDEMQNKLDNLQSYYNVDKTISQTNSLGRAKQVMEFSAADVPRVKYDNRKTKHSPSRLMGY